MTPDDKILETIRQSKGESLSIRKLSKKTGLPPKRVLQVCDRARLCINVGLETEHEDIQDYLIEGPAVRRPIETFYR